MTTSSACTRRMSRRWRGAALSVMPPPGAVCPSTVRLGLVMSMRVSVVIVPLTRKITMRGPVAVTQSRNEPGPLSSRLVTWHTRPPRPPGVSAPQPCAEGNASGVTAGGSQLTTRPVMSVKTIAGATSPASRGCVTVMRTDCFRSRRSCGGPPSTGVSRLTRSLPPAPTRTMPNVTLFTAWRGLRGALR